MNMKKKNNGNKYGKEYPFSKQNKVGILQEKFIFFNEMAICGLQGFSETSNSINLNC